MGTLRYHEILSPESAQRIDSMSVLAQRIADRWVMGWPKSTQSLDAQGTLLEELASQVEREGRALADARQGGEKSYLADHEIMELYGISPRPPA